MTLSVYTAHAQDTPEPTPLKVPYAYNGESHASTTELAEITAREHASGGHSVVWITCCRWLGDDDEDGGEFIAPYPVDTRSTAHWQGLIDVLYGERPGIDWLGLIEPFKVRFAPSLPPLVRTGSHKRALLTVDDLQGLPPLDWLIDGCVPSGAFAVLYGPSGAGKTFLALDLALSVSAAVRWLGHDVRGGPTLYVAAEGIGGLAQRVKAWRSARAECDLSGVRFLPDAVNLLDERAVSSLLADIADMDLPPALIVLDTLARCIPGADENSAQDVGRAVAAIDRIRAATGATVLLIHHTGKNGDSERGSSALRGAADTMLAVSNDDGLIRVECAKQKDDVPFDRLYARLVSSGDSAFIGLDSGIAVIDLNAPLSGQETATLEVLTATFGEDGATPKQIAEQARIPERTVYTTLRTLIARGVVTKTGKAKAVRYFAAELS